MQDLYYRLRQEGNYYGLRAANKNNQKEAVSKVLRQPLLFLSRLICCNFNDLFFVEEDRLS
ncbi:MAG: hypothetical protein WBH03_18885, partial [Cyclobacteriaceae bacterium]